VIPELVTTLQKTEERSYQSKSEFNKFFDHCESPYSSETYNIKEDNDDDDTENDREEDKEDRMDTCSNHLEDEVAVVITALPEEVSHEVSDVGKSVGKLFSQSIEDSLRFKSCFIPRYCISMSDSTGHQTDNVENQLHGSYMGSDITANKLPQGVFDSFELICHQSAHNGIEKEIKILLSLSHVSVLTCFGFMVQSNGSIFQIFEEYCSDMSLYYPTSAFTDLEFCRLFDELLTGLEFLHAKHISHGNLCPQVLSLSDPHKLSLKIRFDATLPTDKVLGTVYQPPEVLSDGLVDGIKVDVYAVGILMWELWHKQVPWIGVESSVVSELVLRGERPNNDTTLPALKHLMEWCWKQESAPRIRTSNIHKFFDDVTIPAIKIDHEQFLK